MKLSARFANAILAVALSLKTPIVAASSVAVHPEFVTEAEAEALLNAKLDKTSEFGLFGETSLSHKIVNGLPRGLSAAGVGGQDDEEPAATILAKMYTKTTESHSDHHAGEGGLLKEEDRAPLPKLRSLVEDMVGFIFLNTNEDAEFIHGDERIPVVARTLVTFPGNVKHNTVVNNGVVRIAGPFHMRTLQSVGEESNGPPPVTGDKCQVGTPTQVDVTSYETVDGDTPYQDESYPAKTFGCIVAAAAPYGLLQGGQGDLTDGTIPDSTSDFFDSGYVGWKFNGDDSPSTCSTDDDVEDKRVEILFHFAEDTIIESVCITVYDDPGCDGSGIVAPEKVNIGGDDYDFPDNPGGAQTGPFTACFQLNSPIVIGFDDPLSIELFRAGLGTACGKVQWIFASEFEFFQCVTPTAKPKPKPKRRGKKGGKRRKAF